MFIEDETFTLNTTYSVLSAVQNPCLSSGDNCLTTAMARNDDRVELVYGSCAEECVWPCRADKLKESPGRFRCTWGGRSCSWLLFHSRRASRCEARTSWHTGSPTRTEGSRKTQTLLWASLLIYLWMWKQLQKEQWAFTSVRVDICFLFCYLRTKTSLLCEQLFNLFNRKKKMNHSSAQ